MGRWSPSGYSGRANVHLLLHAEEGTRNSKVSTKTDRRSAPFIAWQIPPGRKLCTSAVDFVDTVVTDGKGAAQTLRAKDRSRR